MSVHKVREAHFQPGQVRWMGLRPARGEAVAAVERVEATTEEGLVGDRYSGKPDSERQVSLIQFEHLSVIAAILGQDKPIRPEQTRRNIVVSGINLTALKGTEFRIGGAILRGNGGCAPCSKMEYQLGNGGYNAMRGHGGIVATVIESGTINVGDEVNFTRLVIAIEQ